MIYDLITIVHFFSVDREIESEELVVGCYRVGDAEAARLLDDFIGLLAQVLLHVPRHVCGNG
jgi:hypothetical protein